jgi:protein-tyrosine phosphatase
MDLTPLSRDDLERAVSYVRTHIHTGIVLVHCALGYARSAEVIAACLIAERHAHSVQEAEQMIRRSRPQIVLSSRSRQTLESYQQELHPLLDKRLAS